MESEEQQEKKYIAVIVSEVKHSSRELYPLTKNYSMGLLPVGTKKIIVYQLQSLIPIRQLSKVVIIVSEKDKSLRTYLESQFLPQHKDYPHQIEFFTVKDLSNTFIRVKELLTVTKTNYQGLILLHADTIVGVSLSELVNYHQKKESDLTLLLKAKRQLGEQQKKLPDGDIQTQLDIALLGQQGEVLFMDMLDEFENNGVKIDPSVYGQARKAAFKRVLDSKVYVMSQRVGRMIVDLESEEIYQIKPWLIQLLIQHQTNKKLLNIKGKINEKELQRLKVFAQYCQQDAFIRKISAKKIYELINFESLIRGPKQKLTLMPNNYSDRSQYKPAMTSYIAENAVIGAGSRIRRCIIGPGSRIGKNVELYNTILLQNVELKDNCKVTECVLGAGTSIGESAQIKSTYSESGCRVADSAKIEAQTLIRNQ